LTEITKQHYETSFMMQLLGLMFTFVNSLSLVLVTPLPP